MTNGQDIQIRSLHQIEELEEARKLESKIWGQADSIPTHQTITAVKNGGLVLGAFDGERLVAFQYSFPGFNGKSVYLCSHILATDVEYRNKGIGEMLKLAQRDAAIELGYSLITWTYDPLESVNGYLNIAKLGGISSTYIENCYGEMEDLLNDGIPSDRFLVEWHIAGNSKQNSSEEFELEDLIKNSLTPWELHKDGYPIPASPLPLSNDEGVAFVAIPKQYQFIKDTNIEAAMSWRLNTRTVFSQAFKQGWQVNGFAKNSQYDIPVNFYILRKDNSDKEM
ncbi:GNAT family N-acetyltransferase [Bacillus sp. BRMEA1]|uniref:GNAT family N-acetyltransferase n=1 Tax=Neobacillus endophyticus TaxID=2738405 RepID=UPI001563F0EB|nr:GNAT family N-acetyltransferase [Neobacillus endophyticus]NRD79425.1 GNAT family N-acetyltransferase [Neobacillus endophyticus]